MVRKHVGDIRWNTYIVYSLFEFEFISCYDLEDYIYIYISIA